ncbi:hypothetical protein WICANDRAFT_33843 [Wickerhamomyces anomalus NRRL Y-366-8]|uniref:Derlin n=1 Tax=Wickerhamomyces anomalus (strain ATCC 58044 / CBS 1984 / NCYC 433 / NRRL Y-366-8) TaxID=683960 RepID=A0A1E3NYU8_WICAA|nr:uncharacterized protein WICANDRAFT_33843 [Wickerhamomyces anomalus NRRL Y-366-8]ODQ58214.1 hypothetical protein WICANDRAFT_33843 [Wickerhamomyces anomalus NRRL Y-366-8]
MERIPVNWITDIPIVTRTWTVSILLTSVLVDSNIIKLHDIILTPNLIRQQPWRLITCFLFMGHFDINLVLSLYLIVQYSRQLEESFNRTRDYLWFITTCSILLILYSTYIRNLGFLGNFLNEALNYIWSRQNPDVMMGFLGLIEFKAGYLSFLLIFMSFLRNPSGWDYKLELAPFFIGHVVFYFDAVWAKVFGFNPLAAPWNWL